MRLSSEQTTRLLSALQDNFNDFNLEMQITRQLDPPLGLDDIAHGVASRQEKILLVIKHFEELGKVEALLRWANEARGDVVAFGQLLEELIPAPLVGGSADLFQDTLTVTGGQPVVDRQGLRQELGHLRKATRKVLVVEGEPRSGRSYSLQLIYYGAEVYKDFEPCYVNLLRLKLPDEDLRPEQVGTDLALKIGIGDPPARNAEQDSAWNRRFGSWFQGKMKAVPERIVWIIVDHSDKIPLRPGVEDFILELIDQCDKLDNVRLILLGYRQADRLGSDLVLVWPVSLEQIPSITEEHVMEYFFTYYGQRRGQLGLASDEAVVDRTARSVSRVLASKAQQLQQPNPPDPLACLKQAIEAEIGQVSSGGD